MTSDQEQLLKKAHESLLAARVLEREEMYDFSASRSYYAMFSILSKRFCSPRVSHSPSMRPLLPPLAVNLPSKGSFLSSFTAT